MKRRVVLVTTEKAEHDAIVLKRDSKGYSMNYSLAELGKRALVFGFAACATLGVTGTAHADDNTHDGFYLQAATGLGYYGISAESLGREESLSGMTIPMSLMLGGSPMEGLAIGGGFMFDYAPSPTYEVDGQEFDLGGDISQYVVAIGPFADFYLDPAGGLHFQAFAGWGGLETSAEGNVGGSDPTGFMLSLGAGYDFFVSPEWSIGGLGRFTYGALSMNDVSSTLIEPQLLITATYH